MHELIKYICEEMEDIERKVAKDGKLSMTEIEYVDKLAHIKKNLLKADEMWEESEYSNEQGGGSYARGNHGGRSNTIGGGSYARGRNRGANQYGSYARGYSREGGYSMATNEVIDELRELMQDAPDHQTRQDIQRIVDRLEQA